MATFLLFIGKLLSCCGLCFEEEEFREPLIQGSQKQLSVKPSTTSHSHLSCANSTTPITSNATGLSVPDIHPVGHKKYGDTSAEKYYSLNFLGSQKTQQKVILPTDTKAKRGHTVGGKEKSSSQELLQQSQNLVSKTKTTCLGKGSTNDTLNKTIHIADLSKFLAAPKERESLYCQENIGSQQREKVTLNSTKASDLVEINFQGYCSSHKILLVGEGDFSFSACLAKAFGSATNMVATSLNPEEYLKRCYIDAMNNICELRTRGCKVFHEVDATRIESLKRLTRLSFDRIIYNFPHCGDFTNTIDALRKNQSLIRWFMRNAAMLIKEDGEIHIRHKSNYFYRTWNLRKLASQAGLVLIDEAPFDATLFDGYNTKYGFNGGRFGCDDNFDCHSSSTYKFVLQK